MNSTARTSMLALFATLVLVACGEPPVNTESAVSELIDGIPVSNRELLAQKKIFFGHQSVGRDILSGLGSLSTQGLTIKVTEGRSPDALAQPALAHSKIGSNRNPSSKIQDFAAAMRSGMGEQANIAFFKFCYLDFEPGVDVEKVFDEYSKTMGSLKIEYPSVKFAHFTVPLTTIQTGPKALVKSLLGRKPAGVEANIVRNQFNERLRKEYGGREPLFDLALIESTAPNGKQVTFESDGHSYPMLVSGYASDGSHLNEGGARWVGAKLASFLSAM